MLAMRHRKKDLALAAKVRCVCELTPFSVL